VLSPCETNAAHLQVRGIRFSFYCCGCCAGGHDAEGGVASVAAGGGTLGVAAFAPAGVSFAFDFTVAFPFASVSYGCQRGGR
jgi:hypothetical protein